MPFGDGTGPQGKGPGTGRGMGGCGAGQGRGKGSGSGNKYFGGVDFNELQDRTGNPPANLSYEGQDIETLKRQANRLQEQMDLIRKRIEELAGG